MKEQEIVFEEKQYLGYNKFSILRRIILSLFCFIAYYWSENPKPVEVSIIRIGAYPVQEIPNSGQLFFLMGIIILLSCGISIFVLHIKTSVTPVAIHLSGLWTSRKVIIPINMITQVRKIKYKSSLLNRPVYNLHYKNKVRFYTKGTDLLEVTDDHGTKYRIGTQRVEEFKFILGKLINREF